MKAASQKSTGVDISSLSQIYAPTNHVEHYTGNQEWYTPSEYVEAARRVMGEIDLDPASSELAQETVRASSYYTKDDDGLVSEWSGRVWLNPPYSHAQTSFYLCFLFGEASSSYDDCAAARAPSSFAISKSTKSA